MKSGNDKNVLNLDEKAIEKESLERYNESLKGKVEPQNHEHNARKEGIGPQNMMR